MGFLDNAFSMGMIPSSGGMSLGALGDKGRNLAGGLPFVGGMFKGIFGDPEQEAMQRAYEQAQQQMAMQRNNMMDSRMNAMGQGALAFGPRNQMLGEMMGKGPNSNAMDLSPMMQNPMSPSMQGSIRQAAFGSAPPQNAPPGMGGGLAPSSGAFSGVGQQNPYRRQ